AQRLSAGYVGRIRACSSERGVPGCYAARGTDAAFGCEARDRPHSSHEKNPKNLAILGVGYCWWPGAESNHRHADFQSAALPTELPGQRRGETIARTCETYKCFCVAAR